VYGGGFHGKNNGQKKPSARIPASCVPPNYPGTRRNEGSGHEEAVGLLWLLPPPSIGLDLWERLQRVSPLAGTPELRSLSSYLELVGLLLPAAVVCSRLEERYVLLRLVRHGGGRPPRASRPTLVLSPPLLSLKATQKNSGRKHTSFLSLGTEGQRDAKQHHGPDAHAKHNRGAHSNLSMSSFLLAGSGGLTARPGFLLLLLLWPWSHLTAAAVVLHLLVERPLSFWDEDSR